MNNENAASSSLNIAGQPPQLPGAIGASSEVKRIPHVGRIAASLLLLVIIGDYFLWGHHVGLSAAFYAVLLAAAICLNRPKLVWKRRHGVELGLLLLASIQTALRPSLSNGLVLGALLLIIAGDTCLSSLRPVWARWLSAAASVFSFFRTWKEFFQSTAGLGNEKLPGLKSGIARVIQVSSLAVLLAVLFGLLLGSGNAVLRNSFDRGFQGLMDVLGMITLPEFGRIFFWGLLATVALVLLLPRAASWAGNLGECELPTFAVKDIKLERLRSLLALIVVNVLFLFTNTFDVLYLWTDRSLPEGVGYSQYVHEGVWSLGFAVVLSALVITAIFQQDGLVTSSRWVKWLAMIWIAQNLLLEVGVLMRIHLYVDAHWLTPKRVYVVLFLALVAVGYLQLARQVLAPQFNLKRLLLGNALAIFCLFYLVQFINVPRIAADYNYRQWREDPERNVMQMDFGQVLGDEMIPLAVRVAESGLDVEAMVDARILLKKNGDLRWNLDEGMSDWQEWTWRKDQLRELVRKYANGGEK